MLKVIIVHGWGGTPKGDWYSWLKEQLINQGFSVECPEMPDTLKPKINKWVNKLREVAGEVDKNTFFVGHSIGCQAILRYLETLPEDSKIGGAIFVAGWLHLKDETWDEDYTQEIAKPWLENPINFDKIKKHSDKFIAIASDNDPYVPLSDKDIFKEKLNAEIITLHNKGHISGEDGVTEFPLIIKKIKELTKCTTKKPS